MWRLHCSSAGNNGNSPVIYISEMMLFPNCSAVSLCHCYSPGMEQVGYVVKAISALLKVFLMATSPRRVSLLKEEMKQVVAGRIQKYFSGQSSVLLMGLHEWEPYPKGRSGGVQRKSCKLARWTMICIQPWCVDGLQPSPFLAQAWLQKSGTENAGEVFPSLIKK